MNFPETIQEIYIKLANDVKGQIAKSNPFLNKSLIKAELTAFAGRLKDVYQQIESLIDESFDDTRDGIYLIREAADYGLTLKEATSASGTVSAVGTVGTIIEDETELTINALVYQVDGDTEITEKVKAVDITYSGGEATCVFSEAHYLGNGQDVTISGCAVTALNDTYEIEVTDETTITFEVDLGGSGSTSASAVYDNAVLSLISKGTGEDYNREQGEVLEFSEAIAGVDTQAIVTSDGIVGATDEEDPEELRARLQQRKKSPVAHFNSAEVESILRKHALVDRVFIERCTPQVGEATIYFLKEDNEIPTSGEVETLKDYFEEYLPINDDYNNIFILAPTGVDIDFEFSSITPDTPTMRQAIIDNLDAFFKDYSNVNETIDEDQYRAVIINTIDPLSLERLTNFTLTSPTGDLEVSGGQINLLGDVNL